MAGVAGGGGREDSSASLTYNGEATLLQVWRRDGARKRCELAVAPPAGDPRGRAAIVPLNGGYLYAGGELAWLATEPEAPVAVWRFGGGAGPPRGVARPSTPRVGGFGVPRVVGGRLFAAGAEGGVYVFDVKRIGG